LLNELTNTNKGKGAKRNKAEKQLFQTLQDLCNVPTINSFIQNHTVKQCCFFNKKTQAPPRINATSAFSRINNYSKYGYKISSPNMAQFGFEFWQYSGTQTLLLNVAQYLPQYINDMAHELYQLSHKETLELLTILEQIINSTTSAPANC
jgi:hypothetical protein